jgi:GNAT superfamily N-acetyltransferase
MSGFELDEVEYRIRKPAPAAPLQIRPFESGDEDALFALMTHWDKDYAFDKAVFLASLEAILGSPDADILLAFQGRDLVGYAQTAICRHLGFAPFLEVVQLLVSAERRSSGTGRKLMERAEDLARSKGLNSVKLSSQVMRSRAHVFYERLGYMFYKISKFYEKVL